ncbi:high affinity immunoglobulin alpha and immunoglobulin mu Fc receptor [Macrotis lagotis]|uniref:high affinity immunoglobulin alpha and immunoglobulin mu Fc receptor n=1 Tax=Macrotis lagotis TaxID=92651 RepID=UPI003D68B884
MEKNSLIQLTGQGGTYLKAGWKMIPFFVLCVLQDASALKGPRLVTGDPGGTVTIECHYTPTPVNKHQRKYWCRLYPPQRVCQTIISTNLFISPHYQDRVTLLDFPSRGIFVVTLTQLTPEDAGYYRCGIGSKTDMLSFRMNLTVSTVSQDNHSLDSTILTIPSSIIPMTTRGQTMEVLGTSTSALDRQELDTFQVVKRWEERTTRIGPTAADITQVLGSIGETTVTGGQGLDTTMLAEGWETKTSKREITPDKVTPAPRSIAETTIVTGGQGLDTTMLAEGWETRTSKRESTPDKVTPAPRSIAETTVTGTQGLDTTLLAEGWEARTSKREITPDKVTPAPRSIAETTIVTGGQGLDTTMLAEGWETRTSKRESTPDKVTPAPRSIAETTVTGTQGLDTTLLAEGWEARTSKGEITPDKVTPAPRSIAETTIVTGGQGLDTTMLAEGWETRTSKRESTPDKVTPAPRSIAETTVTGTQGLDTTLLAEGWEARTSKREITPDKVTPAPRSIAETTTVTGEQGLDTTLLAEGWETRTSKREITPDKVTPAPRSIAETTTVTGEQGLDTTLLAEGWETRTSKREITPDKVTPAPRSIAETTTVTGEQGLDTTLFAGRWKTRSSRGDTTPDEITQVPGSTGATAPVTDGWVPKTITTSFPGSQVFDTTMVINDHGAETCRGDIIPTRVTKTSGTIRAITSVVGRQTPGTFGGITPASGRQALDTSRIGKELEVGIGRGALTQLPVQVSSKTTKSPETVRLAIPSTVDWILETTKVADPIPEGQTSRAKITLDIMKGGLIWGTRATTKAIVGAIRERKSTIRSTNRLTKETVNIEIPLITIRPSTMVRDSFRELPAGTAQQTQEITRTTAPDVDVGVWISGTFRKRKASAFRGTAAIGRESHSKEPLRRISGTGLMIPPRNKSCMENSPPDQRRVSQILVTFSTVLLPLVLLVLLLLLKKLRKRISLRTQKMPMLSSIQLTNFQDLPKKLNLEALQTQEV